MDLKEVQTEIERRWGLSEYSAEYKARPDAQRDAHHAALHITKALGKIAGALDAIDHGNTSGNIESALADIVICVARIASRWPDVEQIDISEAVRRRIEDKFPTERAG